MNFQKWKVINVNHILIQCIFMCKIMGGRELNRPFFNGYVLQLDPLSKLHPLDLGQNL